MITRDVLAAHGSVYSCAWIKKREAVGLQTPLDRR